MKRELKSTCLVRLELFNTDATCGSGSGWCNKVCDLQAFSPSPQIDAPLSMGSREGTGASPAGSRYK